MPTGGITVTGPQARFRWERALRADRTLPWHVQSFLYFVGTYMDGDGRNAYPSVARMSQESGLAQSTIHRLLREAEQGGWVVSVRHSGKPSQRFPALPDPSHPREGSPSEMDAEVRQTSLTDVRGHPSHPREGSEADPSHPRDKPLSPVGPNRNRQEQLGGTLPPTPLRPNPPQAPGSTDQSEADQPTGPATNSSPKPGPPPARAKRRRRSRPRGTSPPLLAVVHELPPTGTGGPP
jgi:hypothetical protein